MAARVLDIGTNVAAGGGGLPCDESGIDQQPCAVADRGDRLAFVGEFLRDCDGVLVHADAVDVAGAAGHHQQVVITGVDV